MRDWRVRLDEWVRHWERLPELTQDCFPIRKPSGLPWPSGLPDCPPLADLHARSDGGTFGAYSLSPMAELTDPSAGWLADSPGLDRMKPGRWVDFGSHEYGHTLLWDADADEVLLYSPDEMEPHLLKQTIETFLQTLFFPSAKSDDETEQLWREALEESEGLA